MENGIELLEPDTGVNIQGELDRMKDFTLEELAAERAEASANIHANIVRYAVAVRLQEEKGVNVRDGMPRWMYDLMNAISHGQALPALYILYPQNPKLIDVAITLPIHEQRRLLRDGTLTIYNPPATPDAEPSHRVVPIADVTREDVVKAIDPVTHVIRDEKEQIAYDLKQRRMNIKANADPKKFKVNRRGKGSVSINTSKGWIEISFDDLDTMYELRMGRI